MMTNTNTETATAPAPKKRRSAKPKADASREMKSTRKSKPKSSEPKAPRVTKERRVVEALCRPEGATVLEVMEMTGWQEHSVRGFISGAVKKKLGLTVERITEDGKTIYRIPSVPAGG